MDEYIEKHLVDILNAANEVESFFAGVPKLFQNFQNDMLRQRAVERNVEIFDKNLQIQIFVVPLQHQPPKPLDNAQIGGRFIYMPFPQELKR